MNGSQNSKSTKKWRIWCQERCSVAQPVAQGTRQCCFWWFVWRFTCLDVKSHESFLCGSISHQLLQNFYLSVVLAEMSYFISHVLQQFPVKPQRSMPQKPSDLALECRSVLSSLDVDLHNHCSSINSTLSKGPLSFPTLSNLSEKEPSIQDAIIIWSKQ